MKLYCAHPTVTMVAMSKVIDDGESDSCNDDGDNLNTQSLALPVSELTRAPSNAHCYPRTFPANIAMAFITAVTPAFRHSLFCIGPIHVNKGLHTRIRSANISYVELYSTKLAHHLGAQILNQGHALVDHQLPRLTHTHTHTHTRLRRCLGRRLKYY